MSPVCERFWVNLRMCVFQTQSPVFWSFSRARWKPGCVFEVRRAAGFVFVDSSRCVMKFRCAPLCRTRVTSAHRGASRREGRMERCADHDHGRLWICHHGSLIDALSTFLQDMLPAFVWRVTQLLWIQRSGAVFRVRLPVEKLPGLRGP